jgi:hypothetical protein
MMLDGRAQVLEQGEHGADVADVWQVAKRNRLVG